MPRQMSDAVKAQLRAGTVSPLFLVSIAFPSETIYVWTGVGNLTWNGHTYLGVGDFGQLSTITESSEVEAQGMSLTLSGIPTELIGDVQSTVVYGSKAYVYLGFLDSNGQLIPDPIPAFIGLVDAPAIEIGTDKSTIVISVESRLADLNRARGGRYTMQDQKSRYPSDTSFDRIAWLQDHEFNWK